MCPQENEKAAPESSPNEAAESQKEESRAGKDDSIFPVVGIGASAGGLEAFSSLLKALSPTLDMAYILVPHLDPMRESSFSQILARTTEMPVTQIADGMKIEKNHIYVIPPNCDLAIQDSTLHLTNRTEPRYSIATIDIFMRSLADARTTNAIGVILSGTASDGTLGLMAIKGQGGITFAQDTQSAKYDGMPASAIAAGCVDFVLPPDGIAQELARVRNHPYVRGTKLEIPEPENRDAGTSLTQIFRILRRATRVDFSEYKRPTISRRIRRRMVLHRMENLDEYVRLLHRDRNEVNALYQDLLINVTSFFRNPEAFEALKQVVYPEILKVRENSNSPIRIWVPGCSTGEETYSLAISLIEYLGEERMEAPIQIFGTDLSESAIQHARAGIYKETIEADLSLVRLHRFFHKTDSGYQISKLIRDLCIFSIQNVFSDPPFSRMDLVSCRNVMIYLSQTLQKRVIPTFHYALNPNGFLLIGNTEGYRRKPVNTSLTFGFSVGTGERETVRSEIPPLPQRPKESVKAPVELQREADRLLLARYAPPAVVVNDQLEIVQSRGRTGIYLELPPGKASLNLLKMARSGLLYELQSALEEARKRAAEAVRENVRFDGDGGPVETTIRVVPFKTPVHEEHSFLTIFEPPAREQHPQPGSFPSTAPAAPDESEKNQQISRLKQELAATKEYLQSIIETQDSTNEELQSANEEIQSGNEELQSTNEELQTSKEELESANEELHTVNEEMQYRNELLTQLNNDLTNLLNSVNLPMIMVGADLSVRRFTPHASSVLGLMPNDVGRPLSRLKLKLEVENLEQIMLDVIQEIHPWQQPVVDRDGRSWVMRVTPYRTADNRIDGAVVTLYDSNALGAHPS